MKQFLTVFATAFPDSRAEITNLFATDPIDSHDPRAESFKQWLAQVGEERFVELENPEAAFERIRENYRAGV